ncbi:unnamed protein product [Oppiella nova]|uniref:Amino acid transporter n=1 Tax=Oppiella nova TaxID=334625 RepID=A0A7R9QAZ3_9ACAR|nr:unnamed protein product [Oppiella nova]CAG2162026.1 unnamed protein product [Oppiella nova]
MAKKPLYKSLYFQVIVAIILGVIVGHYFPSGTQLINGVEKSVPGLGEQLKPLGDAFIKLIKMIIAPVIFCTVVSGIAGMESMKSVGKTGGIALLYFEVVSTIALIIGLVVINIAKPGVGMNVDPATLDTTGSISRFCGFSILKMIRMIREELLIVLGTSSSESVLPRMLKKLEIAGCEKSVVGLVIPTGAAGVTGSGFIVMAATLAAVGNIPVAGIDRFMSEARALTNLVGNSLATIVVAKWVGKLDVEKLNDALNNPAEVDRKMLEESNQPQLDLQKS